jgi:hypothetical protein
LNKNNIPELRQSVFLDIVYNKPLRVTRMDKLLKNFLADKLKVVGFGGYTYKHAVIAYLVSQGVDPKDIMTVLHYREGKIMVGLHYAREKTIREYHKMLESIMKQEEKDKQRVKYFRFLPGKETKIKKKNFEKDKKKRGRPRLQKLIGTEVSTSNSTGNEDKDLKVALEKRNKNLREERKKEANLGKGKDKKEVKENEMTVISSESESETIEVEGKEVNKNILLADMINKDSDEISENEDEEPGENDIKDLDGTVSRLKDTADSFN